jgi:hypothetical protein
LGGHRFVRGIRNDPGVLGRRARNALRDVVVALLQLSGLLALQAAGLPFLVALAGVIAATLLALAAAGRLTASP